MVPLPCSIRHRYKDCTVCSHRKKITLFCYKKVTRKNISRKRKSKHGSTAWQLTYCQPCWKGPTQNHQGSRLISFEGSWKKWKPYGLTKKSEGVSPYITRVFNDLYSCRTNRPKGSACVWCAFMQITSSIRSNQVTSWSTWRTWKGSLRIHCHSRKAWVNHIMKVMSTFSK